VIFARLGLLKQDNLVHIDRHDQGFGRGMVVRLETKDPMLRRKDNAGNSLDIGDVVGCTYVAADLDVVIMPLQQSLLIEVQCLLCTVRCDISWESDLQATPCFASFFPRLDFFGLNIRPGKEEGTVHIGPHRTSHEVRELQISPRGLERVPLERGSGVKEFFKYFTGRVLDRDPFGFEARPSIRRTEGPVRNLLVAKVHFDRHVAENAQP
jgi:hypothetical protein